MALWLLHASAVLAAQDSTVAAVPFSARGSVGQIYVTGLRPFAHMSLLNRRGKRIARKRADSLGGLLFRNVKPGRGYRVRLLPRGLRSGRLTVLSARSAPPSADIYNQSIPSN